MADFYGDYIPEIEEEIRAEDNYFEAAKRDIIDLYENDKNSIYYIRQLQVKFEKEYFHWITYRVLKYLRGLGRLKIIERRQQDGTTRHFYIHPSNRYPIRKINKMEEIINEYSQDHITRSFGQRAEDLFSLALMKKGFKYIDNKVKKFKGKTWKKTGHDLDFVFERDGIYYGCEVKNTLGRIEKNELEAKIQMCLFFRICPLFIMRYTPAVYFYEIIKRGGFALIFKYQLYDLSQVKLVQKIREVLELPVDCPIAIYEGTIKRFEDWHIKNLNVNLKKFHK